MQVIYGRRQNTFRGRRVWDTQNIGQKLLSVSLYGYKEWGILRYQGNSEVKDSKQASPFKIHNRRF